MDSRCFDKVAKRHQTSGCKENIIPRQNELSDAALWNSARFLKLSDLEANFQQVHGNKSLDEITLIQSS